MLFARAWYPEVPDSVRRHKALQLRDSSETKYVRVPQVCGDVHFKL